MPGTLEDTLYCLETITTWECTLAQILGRVPQREGAPIVPRFLNGSCGY